MFGLLLSLFDWSRQLLLQHLHCGMHDSFAAFSIYSYDSPKSLHEILHRPLGSHARLEIASMTWKELRVANPPVHHRVSRV